MGLFRRIFGEREELCKHERNDIWPSEDAAIWHLREKNYGHTYFSENDAGYVELEAVKKHFKCLGCGEEKTIETGEKTGRVKWKDELSREELSDMREDVMVGGFFNGFDSKLWRERN